MQGERGRIMARVEAEAWGDFSLFQWFFTAVPNSARESETPGETV